MHSMEAVPRHSLGIIVGNLSSDSMLSVLWVRVLEALRMQSMDCSSRGVQCLVKVSNYQLNTSRFPLHCAEVDNRFDGARTSYSHIIALNGEMFHAWQKVLVRLSVASLRKPGI